MIRLGLCCAFRNEPIKFRTTTAAATKKLRRDAQLARLSGVCRTNAEALMQANYEKCFRPADLLDFCRSASVPFVYDVHHHRCNPDGISVEDGTQQAMATWNREPLVHISSPLEGWSGPKPHRHHDFIDAQDFPECWHNLRVTVEVEAKAKELAVERLRLALAGEAR